MRSLRMLAAALGAVFAISLVSAAHAESERDGFTAKPAPRATAAQPVKKPPTQAARKKAPEAPKPASVAEVIAAGNNSELRSEGKASASAFGGLVGGSARLLPQTQALDSVLEKRQKGKTFAVKDAFLPQTVPFSGYPRGTIVINTKERFLYLVESSSSARRYAIAVGRDGLEFKGSAKVGDKQEWPRWIPTADMQKREPKKYGQYKDGMPGGPDNPLGARAIYLHQNNKDTHIRIHGTNQPQSIGTNSSNGCFRMINEHVMDLYGRVPLGAQVIVL
jgi:lipoprotein-anchoring transpeptidase ErfK/SrfK